jgi:hypothetical protein
MESLETNEVEGRILPAINASLVVEGAELVRTARPSKDRLAKGTGAAYDVFKAGAKLGQVHSARLNVPAPRGQRYRSGALYTAWGADPVSRVEDERDWHAGRTSWHESRKTAVRRLVELAGPRAS